MNRLISLFFCISIFLFSTICCADLTNEKRIREFFDKHLEKVVNKDYEAVYSDYSPSLRSVISLQQFKSVFTQQLEPIYGELKSATFKTLERGKRYEPGKQYDIVILFYKAEVKKPNTYIRAEVAEFDSRYYVVTFQYINFTDTIPDKLK